MDDYNWDDFDAQTAEYLTNDPTWSNYDWSPEQSSWIDDNYGDWLNDYSSVPMYLDNLPAYDYSSPDISSMLLQQGLPLNQVYGGDLLGGITSLGGFMPQELAYFGVSPYQDSYYDMSDAYGQTTGLPLELHIENLNGQDFVMDEQGNVLGYRDDTGTIKYYSDIANNSEQAKAPSSSKAAPSVAGSAQKLLDTLAAKQLAQMQAKDKYSQSGVGQAMSGLALAASLAKALGGKNQGATVSARGNQGQAFAPSYIGSSAPKTLYASGGGVKGKGGLLSLAERMAHEIASSKGLIGGDGGGQDDIVDIKAAPGEYVMDAEIVSALGDGNNDEGARKLDEMRVNIRKHKRTGGLASIPPKAKAPEQYMKKGK